MYLSKIQFDPSRLRCRDLAIHHDLFREHQMIWDLFDNQPDTRRDFLYRREDTPGQLPFYYLLSRRQPLCREGTRIDTKPYQPLIREGDHLAFILRANAVITRKVDDHSKRRRRFGIVDAKVAEYKAKYTDRKDWPPPAVIHQEAAEQWMNRQAGQHGFRLDALQVSNHQYHKIRKPGDGNLRQFTSLDMDGLLTVEDPVLLENALLNGLGRSKAFGCGLLLVRRA